ncbi:MAG: NAD(P)-dependent oxidoreductase [Rickettsiales bacterium]|nr:NAD(P)-dependent oxidoreductase [Rickettsiales bacterium]
MKKVLITGATGYVGNHLVKHYLDAGYEVVACARTQEHLDMLAKQYKGKALTIEALDIADAEATRTIVAKHQADVIVHAAAFPRRKATEHVSADVPFEQTELYKVNVEGARNLAQATLDAGHPAHICFINSGAVFDQSLAKVDLNSTRDMNEPFARSKNLAEQEVSKLLKDAPGITTSILYAPVIIDKTQIKGMIPAAAKKAIAGETIENNAPDGAGMNMMLADDLGKVVQGVSEHPPGAFVQYPLNGYRSSTVALLEKVANVVAAKTGKKVDVVKGETRFNGMPDADETAIRQVLGADFQWKPIDEMVEIVVNAEIRKANLAKAAPIAAAIKEAFPGQERQALAGPVAIATLGAIPPYSNRDDYHMHNCTTLMAGAFVAAHGVDKSRRDVASNRMGEPVVVVIERGDKGPDGSLRYGLLGGFMNLDYVVKNGVKDTSRGEQPHEGALREFGEELIGPTGKPIITPDESRLEPLISGVDYRRTKSPATFYTGFGLKLTEPELEAIRAHEQAIKTDPTYAANVKSASGSEVAKVMVKPISEVLAMSRESFTHPHEFDAVVKLSEQLKQQSKGAVVGAA